MTSRTALQAPIPSLNADTSWLGGGNRVPYAVADIISVRSDSVAAESTSHRHWCPVCESYWPHTNTDCHPGNHWLSVVCRKCLPF